MPKKIHTPHGPTINDITMPPKEHHTRIAYINANGIITRDTNRFNDIATYMAQHQIDIFGISETNVNTHHTNIYRTLHQTLKSTLKQKNTMITASHTNLPWKQQYKPGGVMILTNNHLTANTTSRQTDQPYGRWATITIGPKSHQISIITAYIVCNTPICATKHKTAAYQQWTIMSKNNINGHPKKKELRTCSVTLKKK